jgi:hypothetical protein
MNPHVEFVCAFLFALSSWLAVNGIWAQLPALVASGLPEGWALPTYLSLAIQLSNLFPLCYMLLRWLGFVPPTRFSVWFIVTLGAASCWLLGIFWQRTALVGQSAHSVGLLALSVALGGVDCLTSLVFLPVMDALSSRASVVAFAIGEASTGAVCALLSFAVGLALSPSVATTVYFELLAAVTLLSGAAYFCCLMRIHNPPANGQGERYLAAVSLENSVAEELALAVNSPLLPREPPASDSSTLHWTAYLVMLLLNVFQNGTSSAGLLSCLLCCHGGCLFAASVSHSSFSRR